MIVNVGYKNNLEKQTNSRTHMFVYVKKHFIEYKDYKLTSIRGKGKGGYNKKVLKMTQSAYQKLLRCTHRLRETTKANGSCFLYILHNPAFLLYGPNVYKVGFSRDPSRRKKDEKSMFLDESTIMYQKEVPSIHYEKKLHKLLAQYRVTRKREFFDCPFDVIKDTMNML